MQKALRFLAVTALAVGVTGTSLAQGRRSGTGSGPGLDAASVSTVIGTVTSFSAGAGVGRPSLVVNTDSGSTQTFVLGPYRLLQAQSFTLAAGERVEVKALACATGEEKLVAIEVRNLTRGLTLNLRDEDGKPVWMGSRAQGERRFGRGGEGKGKQAGVAQGQGRGQGRGMSACGGSGPDLARSSTFTGQVVRFDGGTGSGQPTLVLGTAQGEVSIRLAPFRALVRTGYTPVPGANLDVIAAPVTVDGSEHLVALSLRDAATGLVIQLRSEDGTPIRSPRGNRPRGRG